jgi:hypothetical protein
VARSRTGGRLYSCEARFERLTQDLEDLAAELGPFIQEEHAVWASDTSPGMGMCPPPISPLSELV